MTSAFAPTIPAVRLHNFITEPNETVVPALFRRVSADLFALLDSEWLIAWADAGDGMRPICRFGACPEAAASLAHIHRRLESTGHGEYLHQPYEAAETPALLFPIRTHGRLAGVLCAGRRREGEYTSSEVSIFAAASTHLSELLEDPVRAVRLASATLAGESAAHELEAAREVQNRLFPGRLPALPGIECYGECRPSAEVGGDFFDLRTLRDGRLSVAIGDVCGKGVPAAMIMAGLQVALRGLSARNLNPLPLVEELNALVCAICPDNFFATMFYAQVDPARRCLHFVNAGHEPPLLLRASGAVECLDAGGTVLGLSRRVRFSLGQAPFQPGDLLLGFTDGITEAQNPEGEYFEAARLVEELRRPGGTVRDTVAQLFAAAEDFCGSRPADDRTLLAVRLL